MKGQPFKSAAKPPKITVTGFNQSFETEYGGEIKKFGTLGNDILIQMAEFVGSRLGRRYQEGRETKNGLDLKMNQIRRFLDALRRIEKDVERIELGKPDEATSGWNQIKNKLILLRPKLAYAAGRVEEVKPLMKVLEPAIIGTAEDPKNRFQQLVNFMEAIVAYHSFYGGRN